MFDHGVRYRVREKRMTKIDYGTFAGITLSRWMQTFILLPRAKQMRVVLVVFTDSRHVQQV
jgi:phenolic acid decarboxylase